LVAFIFLIGQRARSLREGTTITQTHFVRLHDNLGLLDDGYFLVAVVLTALALLCPAVYGLQERKQQPVAVTDSDSPRPTRDD
jgi:hypothetical protein